MPRKKKLKTNGSSILGFSANILSIKSPHADTMIDIVELKISTNDGNYSYEICADTRAPDLNQIKKHVEESLLKAKSDFLNVEISEYPERNYLFFDVQSIGQQQYTGLRK